jgi:tetratricopeptide (TPR) repeat protein
MPDVVTSNTLRKHVVNEVEKQDWQHLNVKAGMTGSIYMYNSLLSRSEDSRERHELFEQMGNTQIKADVVTYNILIDRAANSAERRSWLTLMRAARIDPNIFTYNSLIDKAMSAGERRYWLRQMREANVRPDVYTFTSLMHKAESSDERRKWFQQMQKEGVKGNIITYNILIDKAKSVEERREWFKAMQSTPVGANVITYTTLIDKAESVEERREWFKAMHSVPVGANAITYTTLINKAETVEERRELFKAMQSDQVDANVITYTALIDKAESVEERREWFESMQQAGITPDAQVLVTMARSERANGNKSHPERPLEGSARDLLSKALNCDPQNVHALVEMMTLEDPHRPEESERYGSLALVKMSDPHDRGWVCYRLGIMFAKTHEQQRSIAYFERAIREDPSDARNHAELARQYAFLKRWDDSERHFVIATRLDPHDSITDRWHRNMMAERRRDA